MVAALLLRRAQLIASGEPDPYETVHTHLPGKDLDFIDSETEKISILRLVYVLERGWLFSLLILEALLIIQV